MPIYSSLNGGEIKGEAIVLPRKVEIIRKDGYWKYLTIYSPSNPKLYFKDAAEIKEFIEKAMKVSENEPWNEPKSLGNTTVYY